jgi:DNA-binding CsgD family transcriptional regulator
MDAVELGYTTYQTLAGPPVGFPLELHNALGCGVLGHAGFLDDAWQLGSAEYAQALSDHSPLAIGFFSVFLALISVYQGRCRTAERFASESLIAFRQVGFPFMERNALMVVALARAMQGATDGAQLALAELDGLGVPPTDHNGPMVLQARAWTAMATGDTAGAAQLLQQGVELARWSGACALESWVLHDFVRLGNAPSVVERLQELSRVVEGPFCAARARHALAVERKDPAGLEASSWAFEEIGSNLLAAEAAADAALVWGQRGDPRKATAAQRRSSLLADRCEGARTPVLATSAPVRALLTPRELEIARLAATGLTDKVIAQRLQLSPRTVQNKLYAAYAKLGVTSNNWRQPSRAPEKE